MAALLIENEIFDGEKEGCCGNECKVRKNMDLNGEGAEESISSSDFLASDENSSFQDSSSPPSTSEASEEVDKVNVDNMKFEKQGSSLSGFSVRVRLCVPMIVLKVLNLWCLHFYGNRI